MCSIAHYIQDQRTNNNFFNPRYKIVLKKLSSKLDSIISNPPKSMNGKSRLFDANYFYFLNDFSHYKPIEKIKDQLSVEIENTSKIKPLFRNITKLSYFN